MMGKPLMMLLDWQQHAKLWVTMPMPLRKAEPEV